MPTTSNGLRYPASTDTPDVPRDIGYLAADVDDKLFTPPSCRLYRNAAVTALVSGTAYAISWDTEDWDSDGMHSTSVNPSRITAPIAGLYVITAQVYWNAGSTGYRQVEAKLNSDGTYASGTQFGQERRTPNSSGATMASLTAEVPMDAGDRVELWVTHTQGANLDLTTGAAKFCFVTARWVRAKP